MPLQSPWPFLAWQRFSICFLSRMRSSMQATVSCTCRHIFQVGPFYCHALPCNAMQCHALSPGGDTPLRKGAGCLHKVSLQALACPSSKSTKIKVASISFHPRDLSPLRRTHWWNFWAQQQLPALCCTLHPLYPAALQWSCRTAHGKVRHTRSLTTGQIEQDWSDGCRTLVRLYQSWSLDWRTVAYCMEGKMEMLTSNHKRYRNPALYNRI